MPVYDYLCARCGPFTDLRRMADCDLPHKCPTCGKDAPRAFLTAPYLAAMSAERRLAHATNERSASSPALLSDLKNAHGAGCRCCSGKSFRPDKRARSDANGTPAKSFPTRRPWMLCH
jgi:putative FmdB family regulatory protein